MLGGVRVPGADVFVLQGFELLLCAEFVGLSGTHMLVIAITTFGIGVSAYHVVEWCGVKVGSCWLDCDRFLEVPPRRKQAGGNSAAAERHMSNAK
jgi:hypothetical protein